MNETILQILSKIRPEFEFAGADDFLEQGLLDSYDMVMLVVELEKAFGVSIDGVDIVPENFQNVDAMAALLKKSGARP